jgi:hypothetical protein
MDLIHHRFHVKLDIVNAVLTKLTACLESQTIPPQQIQAIIDPLRTKCGDIQSSFAMELAQFYLEVDEKRLEKKDGKMWIENIILRENYLLTLNQIVTDVRKWVQRRESKRGTVPLYIAELNQVLSQYTNSDVLDASVRDAPESFMCSNCGTAIANTFERTSIECETCGQVFDTTGLDSDDVVVMENDFRRPKSSGTFNPNRHYQFWVVHILARESEDELGTEDDPHGQQLIGRCQAIIKRDRRIVRLLRVSDIRKMLREIGRTDLNKDAPLILRKLTGLGPPQPTDAFLQKVGHLFNAVIEAGEQVKRKERVNRNFYPYYIYKILDSILSPDDVNREIMQFIYLQSDDTLRKNDIDWRNICQLIPELKPTATRRV